MSEQKTERKKVVIVGAGFGGLAAAKSLCKSDIDITLIDKRNYHLFQPLLYQVATADLSPADVAWPIRGIFSGQKNIRVMLSQVSDVDTKNQQVHGEAGAVDYDYLIVASGSRHSYFGNDQWEPFAPGLKRVVDATEIRKRILVAFERAELTTSKEDQQRELTFIIVGGGPTGVEMAGAISELAKFTLARDFRNIEPGSARVLLVEAGDRLLRAFPEKLSQKATKALEDLGVEVRLNTRVSDINAEGVDTPEGFIPSSTVIWGAGVAVPNVAKWLKIETDRSGRIPVGKDLSVADNPNVFVIGDAAKIDWQDGLDVPGIAPAAKQAGKFVGKLIHEEIKTGKRESTFAYRHNGNLATIGRHAAVVDFGKIHLSGAVAWWLWGLAHIYFLIGVRKPLFVAMSWFWSYLTYSRGARLITGMRPLYQNQKIREKAQNYASEKRVAS